MWVLAVVASAVIASRVGQTSSENVPTRSLPSTPLLTGLTYAGSALLLWAGLHVFHLRNSGLAEALARAMPVHAVEAVRAKGYAGPLYNDYGWGGYLMWSLRMPVSLDGRAALAGDDRLDRYQHTWDAQPSWQTDQDLMAAGLIIGPAKAPLTQVLRLDTRFRLAYEDTLAAVFVTNRGQESARR